MKTMTYLLLAIFLALFVACGEPSKRKRFSPYEEQHVAHEFLAKANKLGTDDNEQRMMLFDKAIYHFANIVVRDDANDTLRADALFTLRWIEAYVKHDYEQALQYLNQYFELVGPDHESYPACLAYKADDLWHFGAQDSALYYAYRALEAPHTPNDAIEYICHHILWNIYDSRAMPDSANHHKARHMKIRESRVFEPMSMEQLKSQLQADVIAPTSRRNPIIPTVGIAIVLVVGLYVAYRTIRCRRHTEPALPTSAKTPMSTKTERLGDMLVQGRKAFMQTSMYNDIATMQINERELPNSPTRRPVRWNAPCSTHSVRRAAPCSQVVASTTRNSSAHWASTLATPMSSLPTSGTLLQPPYANVRNASVRRFLPSFTKPSQWLDKAQATTDE